ncbi:hypothetical protein Efla_007427 [Eimeria flavescens]
MGKGLGAKPPPPMKQKERGVPDDGSGLGAAGKDGEGEGGSDKESSGESAKAAAGLASGKSPALGKPLGKGLGVKLSGPVKARSPGVADGETGGDGEDGFDRGLATKTTRLLVGGQKASSISVARNTKDDLECALLRKTSASEPRSVKVASAGNGTSQEGATPVTDDRVSEAFEGVAAGEQCAAALKVGCLSPKEINFPESLIDTELLLPETNAFVVTGSCFYCLGPKAAVEALCGAGIEEEAEAAASLETMQAADATVALSGIKGLYDSPSSLLQWSSTQNASASLSCTQVGKLPAVQFTTALSVWSELVLHQKSQVIAVVGSRLDRSDRVVPSLISSFGCLSGSNVKEQMRFSACISRVYKVLALWGTLDSSFSGQSTVCQLRWTLEFTSKGELRRMNVSGALLAEGPPSAEGALEVILHCVHGVLTDNDALRTLGLAGLSLDQLRDSVLRGEAGMVVGTCRSAKGLQALKDELEGGLGFSNLEAVNAIRICLACWLLSRGSDLQSADLDLIELLLGSAKGSLSALLQRCPSGIQKAALSLRNILYEAVFNSVLKAATKAVQVSFSLPGSTRSQALIAVAALILKGCLFGVRADSPSSSFAEGSLTFSDCICRVTEMVQMAHAFRGLHNLQHVLKTDGVDMPPYLASLTASPQPQLLVQLFFSRQGGLIPFLSQAARSIEDIWRWMAWARHEKSLKSLLRVDSSGSLDINWLGKWTTLDLADFAAASQIVDTPTFNMIGRLLRGASASMMCMRSSNASNLSYATRLLQAVKHSVVLELVERPVVVLRSSDSCLASWTYEELRRVEDWQNFGFPVAARLSDLAKYCPHLFGSAALEEQEAAASALAAYLNPNDFAAGRSLVFFRSAAYNSLHAYELAAASIEAERQQQLRCLRLNWEDLQTRKAELGFRQEEERRLSESLDASSLADSHSARYNRKSETSSRSVRSELRAASEHGYSIQGKEELRSYRLRDKPSKARHPSSSQRQGSSPDSVQSDEGMKRRGCGAPCLAKGSSDTLPKATECPKRLGSIAKSSASKSPPASGGSGAPPICKLKKLPLKGSITLSAEADERSSSKQPEQKNQTLEEASQRFPGSPHLAASAESFADKTAAAVKAPPFKPSGLGAQLPPLVKAKAPGVADGESGLQAAAKDSEGEGGSDKESSGESAKAAAGVAAGKAAALGKVLPPMGKGLGVMLPPPVKAKSSGVVDGESGSEAAGRDGEEEAGSDKESSGESAKPAAGLTLGKAPALGKAVPPMAKGIGAKPPPLVKAKAPGVADGEGGAEAAGRDGEGEGGSDKESSGESAKPAAGLAPGKAAALGKAVPPMGRGLGFKPPPLVKAKASGIADGESGSEAAGRDGEGEGGSDKESSGESAKAAAGLAPGKAAALGKAVPPMSKGLGAKPPPPVKAKAPDVVDGESGLGAAVKHGEGEGGSDKKSSGESAKPAAGLAPGKAPPLGKVVPPMMKGLGVMLPPPVKAKARGAADGESGSEAAGKDGEGEGGSHKDSSGESAKEAAGLATGKAATLGKVVPPMSKGLGAKPPPAVKAKAPDVVDGESGLGAAGKDGEGEGGSDKESSGESAKPAAGLAVGKAAALGKAVPPMRKGLGVMLPPPVKAKARGVADGESGSEAAGKDGEGEGGSDKESSGESAKAAAGKAAALGKVVPPMGKGLGVMLPPPVKAKAPGVADGESGSEAAGKDGEGEGGSDKESSGESAKAAAGLAPGKAAALGKAVPPMGKGLGAKPPPPVKARAPDVVDAMPAAGLAPGKAAALGKAVPPMGKGLGAKPPPPVKAKLPDVADGESGLGAAGKDGEGEGGSDKESSGESAKAAAGLALGKAAALGKAVPPMMKGLGVMLPPPVKAKAPGVADGKAAALGKVVPPMGKGIGVTLPLPVKAKLLRLPNESSPESQPEADTPNAGVDAAHSASGEQRGLRAPHEEKDEGRKGEEGQEGEEGEAFQEPDE